MASEDKPSAELRAAVRAAASSTDLPDQEDLAEVFTRSARVMMGGDSSEWYDFRVARGGMIALRAEVTFPDERTGTVVLIVVSLGGEGEAGASARPPRRCTIASR